MLTEIEKQEYGKIQHSFGKIRESLIKLLVRVDDWNQGAELTKTLRAVEVSHNRIHRLLEKADVNPEE